MKDRMQQILSTRPATAAVVLIAIAARALQLVFFYNIRVDASFQVLATQHLVEGQGISLASVNPADLSQTLYEPLLNWPPGYSLLLAPFYLLFQHNYIAAGITLDLLAAILLVFAGRKILRQLELPAYLVNGFTLCTTFFIYYFYFIASSDAIAISLFVYAIALLQKGMIEKHYRIGALLVIGLLLTLVAWIKYLFLPAVFVLPAFLLLNGYRCNEAVARRAGLILGLLLVAGVGALLLYQRTVSGTAGYISQPQRGFFPRHLLDFYPFLPASFLQPQTLSALTGLPSETGTTIYRVYQVLHVGLMFAWIYFLVRGLRRKPWQPAQRFEWLSFLLALSVTLILLLLSLRVAREEILPGLFWTYAEEARYYGLCFVLLHLLLFLALKREPKLFPGSRLGGVLLCLLLLESGRGLVFTANRLRYLGKEEYSWQYEQRFQRYAASLVPTAPGVRTVIAGSTYFMNHRVSLQTGFPVLYASDLLNKTSWPSTGPVQLLVILRDADRERYASFLQRHAGALRGRWADYSFYLVAHRPS